MFFGKTLFLAVAYVATAQALHGNQTVVTTTKVVSQYTTYCPEPTTFTFDGHVYEVTEATTLTITDCPCTIVEPCLTCTNAPVAPTSKAPPAVQTSLPPAPGPDTTAPAPPVVPTSTNPAVVGSAGVEAFQVSLSFAAAAAIAASYLAL